MGDWRRCPCDECRELRAIKADAARVIYIDPGVMAELIHAADPPTALLDIIERLHALPDADG